MLIIDLMRMHNYQLIKLETNGDKSAKLSNFLDLSHKNYVYIDDISIFVHFHIFCRSLYGKFL